MGIKDIGNKKGTATDIYPKTTAEMMTQSTFTAFGWDFTNETTNGVADLWRLCTDGTSYPRLSWEFPRQDLACPDGVGIEDLLVLSAQWRRLGLTPNTGPDFTGDGNILLDDLAPQFAPGSKRRNRLQMIFDSSGLTFDPRPL